MRKNNENFVDVLKLAVKQGDEDQFYIAEVIEVEDEGENITVRRHGEDIDTFNCKLNIDFTTGDSYYIIPKVGTDVIIQNVEGDNFITFISQVDKIRIGNENESLYDLLDELLDAIMVLNVTTPSGPSGVPINVQDFADLKLRLLKLFDGN